MQIHVVAPGQTLFGIAQAYQLPVDYLIESNQIPNPDSLVVGQTIVIPIMGKYHWLEAGETIYQLSIRYNVPMEEILQINQIADPKQLQIGERIYIPPAPRPVKEVAAYLDPEITGTRSVAEVNKVGTHLTYLNIFSYRINPDGTLTPPLDEPVIQAAYQHRIAPLMVITNIAEDGFSRELVTEFLTNESAQERLLTEAISIMDEKGYLGLDFDLEYLGKENRERYNQFLRKAAVRLRERGYLLSSALAPKYFAEQQGVLYEGHDYAAHGEIHDLVFIMTYEWGWIGGPPMAVAPLDQVRQVMQFAVSQIPSEKLMMGIPLYGYDWTLPYDPDRRARVISPQEAIEIASRYGVAIQFDPVAQSPFFYYIDESGSEHVVWFEDARSIQAKFNLVKELGLRGFFYWVLGRDFPQNWLLVQDNFIVSKIV